MFFHLIRAIPPWSRQFADHALRFEIEPEVEHRAGVSQPIEI